ncbi:hypothetical protein ABT040_22210 [Streptomyces sp. NPDC002688]
MRGLLGPWDRRQRDLESVMPAGSHPRRIIEWLSPPVAEEP